MSWLKHVIVDLAVTAALILAAVLDIAWLRFVLLAYTALVVVLKLAVLAGSAGAAAGRLRAPGVPDALFHVLYGLSVGIAALAAWDTGLTTWWLIAGGWLAIWLLSVAAERRARAATVRR